MRKLSIYTLLLLLLFSCKEEETNLYTIKGTGIKEGTVYLWSNNDSYKEILSTTGKGNFTLSIAINSATTLTLALPDGKTIPLFAEPGMTATLQPDTILKSGWCVKGGKTQALHDSISRLLDATDNLDKQKKIIDSFINKYPKSEVVVELFHRYLLDTPAPENDYLRRKITKLSGTQQDHQYFVATAKRLDKKSGNAKHRMFPTFNYTTSNNRKVNAGTYSDKYLLVNIWATWNSESYECVKNLRNIKDSVKSESFAILNISLDSDTAAWRNAVVGDSIIGDNVIDIKGMNSDVIETFNITSLPYTLLVTPYKRITEYGLVLDSLAAASIDSLTRKHDAKIEDERKKEKEKEKNKKKK